MKPTSHEQDKQHAFDSFCKKILKHEARDYYDEMKRQRDHEVSFSELSEQELAQLSTTDKYFATEQTFSVLGRDVMWMMAIRERTATGTIFNECWMTLTKGK